MAAFPQYKQEEIETWTWDKTAKIAAMAEWVLNLKGTDISLQWQEPNQVPMPPVPPSFN